MLRNISYRFGLTNPIKWCGRCPSPPSAAATALAGHGRQPHLEALDGPLEVGLHRAVPVVLLLHRVVGEVHARVGEVLLGDAEARVAEAAEALAVEVHLERREAEAERKDAHVKLLAAHLPARQAQPHAGNQCFGTLCLAIFGLYQ